MKLAARWLALGVVLVAVLAVALVVAASPATAEGISCLDREGRSPAPGERPPPTHPELRLGLEALESACWEEVAACMCLAEERWPEDVEVARFYDRWFARYLPRYYLGLALYRLGCFAAARIQLEKSLLNEPAHAKKAPAEAEDLRRMLAELAAEAGAPEDPLCARWRPPHGELVCDPRQRCRRPQEGEAPPEEKP